MTLAHNLNTIVVVDDNTANLKVAAEHLETNGFEVIIARDGESGIERIRRFLPGLVLLDVQMPGIDGFETARRLKAETSTADIPIIFTTVLSDVEDKLRGFDAGGVDYITKPFHLKELLARVKTHLTLYRLQKQLHAEIEQRKIMEGRLRQFVSDASHELRSPLTILGGCLEVLRLGARDNPEQFERIQTSMESEVSRLSRLVIDLITLTQFDTKGQQQLQLDEVILSDLLKRLQSNFSLIIGKRQLELMVEPGLSKFGITGDVDQLYQVLNNLVDNALRYTAPDGFIRLYLGWAAPDFGWRGVVIKVEDNGCGIAPAKLPYIFDRFYRADASRTRRTGNAGLGLSISKSIIEAHGGQIQVVSTPDVGTTFSVYLPANHNLS